MPIIVDSHTSLRRIQTVDVSKTESMVVLAEYLFFKLSLSDTYTIDQSAKYMYKETLLCHCGFCKPNHASSGLGDTSIGELSQNTIGIYGEHVTNTGRCIFK